MYLHLIAAVVHLRTPKHRHDNCKRWGLLQRSHLPVSRSIDAWYDCYDAYASRVVTAPHIFSASVAPYASMAPSPTRFASDAAPWSFAKLELSLCISSLFGPGS